MKITQYQRDVLDSLVVERLSSNKLNQAIAQTFRNDKNAVTFWSEQTQRCVNPASHRVNHHIILRALARKCRA